MPVSQIKISKNTNLKHCFFHVKKVKTFGLPVNMQKISTIGVRFIPNLSTCMTIVSLVCVETYQRVSTEDLEV